MSSSDFIKQVFLIGLLIFISTGLSLFDKESRFNKLNTGESNSPKNFQANMAILQTPGGGIQEEPVLQKEEEPLLEKESSPDYLPLRDWNVPDPELSASGAIVYRLHDDKIFYQKNIYEPLPIASLTKLLTALVVSEQIDINLTTHISQEAVLTESEAGGLVVGEEISVRNLLYTLLIESSNDAATALQEYFSLYKTDRTLIDTMNRRALELGLSHVTLKNPSGLDERGEISNTASAIDLAVLAKYIWRASPVLFTILSTPVIDVQSTDGRHNHHLVTSNKLLGVLPEVIAGKTGYTEKAGESLLVYFVLPSGDVNRVFMSVVLGSQNREGDTRILIDWIKKAYRWESL